MASARDELGRFADGFDWRDGFREIVASGASNRDIVDRLDLTQGGSIKRASAMRAAQRYRKAIAGGTGQSRGKDKGGPHAAAQAELQRMAASAQLRRPMALGWKARVRVRTNGKGAGTRGQDLAPTNGFHAAADALARGDMDAAGAAFDRALTQQYGAGSWLIIDGYEKLEFHY